MCFQVQKNVCCHRQECFDAQFNDPDIKCSKCHTSLTWQPCAALAKVRLALELAGQVQAFPNPPVSMSVDNARLRSLLLSDNVADLVGRSQVNDTTIDAMYFKVNCALRIAHRITIWIVGIQSLYYMQVINLPIPDHFFIHVRRFSPDQSGFSTETHQWGSFKQFLIENRENTKLLQAFDFPSIYDKWDSIEIGQVQPVTLHSICPTLFLVHDLLIWLKWRVLCFLLLILLFVRFDTAICGSLAQYRVRCT